jgi:hypothetical protein
MSHGSEHVDNLLDGVVGAVVGGFDLAVWTVVGVCALVAHSGTPSARRLLGVFFIATS